MNKALFSVVTVTLNAEKVLPRLVESLRKQNSGVPFEWIVVDGSSKDGTLQIIRSADDVITKYISEPDCGFYDALNKAVRLVSTDYYLVMGADDELLPDAFFHLNECIVRDKNTELILCSVIRSGKIIRPHFPNAVRNALGWVKYISSHSVGTVIKRSLHDSFGMYSMKYPLLADGHFLKNAVQGGAKISLIEQPVGIFAEGGMTSTNQTRIIAETWMIQIHLGENLFIQTCFFLARLLRNCVRGSGTKS